MSMLQPTVISSAADAVPQRVFKYGNILMPLFTKTMSARNRLFAILWVAGWMGVLSTMLLNLTSLLAALSVTAGKPLPFSPLVVKLLSLIQTTVILTVAIFIGRECASKVGLSAPVAEALSEGRAFSSILKPQITPGLMSGLAGGIAIIASWVLARPFLPPAFVARAEDFNRLLPFLTRLLYGGITEEVLVRWGLLTLLVWTAWRVLQKGQGRPQTVYFVGAIVLSSVLFGLGHVPLAFAMTGRLTVSIVFYVVIANSIFGLIAGYLYWKKGLEAAIIAHMMAHLVIVTASHFGR